MRKRLALVDSSMQQTDMEALCDYQSLVRLWGRRICVLQAKAVFTTMRLAGQISPAVPLSCRYDYQH